MNVQTAQAANRTFTSTNPGCNGNFSTAACWGGTLPAAADTLRINGTCTFDNAASNLAYGSLEISRATAGSKVQWPVGGTNTLQVTSVISGTAGAGSIDMTNGGTLHINTSWTSTNTTLTSGTGTVEWNVTGANSTLPAAIPTYNNLTVTVTGRTATLGIATTVNGNLTITGGTLASGNFNLTVNGNFTDNGSFTRGTATVTFDGSANQSVGGTTATAFNNLTINKTSGTATLTNNVTAAGNLTVTAGTFDLSSFTANRASAGGVLTVSNGATLKIDGTNTFPANYSTDTLGATSIVEYYGSTQTVGAQAYGNLILSGSGTKSMLAGTSVAGNLSIAPTGSAKASIAAGQNINAGTLTTGGLGTINGTWGSTASSATNQEDTYFAATTGIVTVATDTRGNQATLTAIATPSTVPYGTTSTLSAAGGSGTGAVTFSAGASTGCSIAGTVLSVTNASGNCSVTVTKAADKHYLSATSAPITVTLTKGTQATLTAVATPPTVAYGSTSTLSSTGGSGTGAVTFSAGASTGCSITGVTTLNVTDASGTCSVGATKAADNNYNQATSAALPVTLTKKNITVTAIAASKLYGEADPAFAYTSSDPAATFSGALGRVSGENPGIYAITIGSLAVIGNNYTIATFVPADFTINNPSPILNSITPTSTTAGSGGFTLTLNGTGFAPSSTVNWNGSSKATTFISATHITASILSSDVAATGTVSVTVTNPVPGGGTSGAQTFTINAAASKFVIINPGDGTAGTPLSVTIQAQDANNQLVPTYSGGVTLNASGTSVTGGGLVSIVNGVGTKNISTNVAQTVSLSLSDSEVTGFNVSSAQSAIFVPGPLAKFALNDPGNMNTGARLGYTVSRKDQYNNLISAGATVVYLYSNSTSTSKAFFDAESGGNQIASTTIQAGSTSTQFWYYDTAPGTYTATASNNPAGPGGIGGVTDATDSFNVVAGAVKFIFANVPASATAGDTITFNVYAVDSFNTIDTSFNQDVTVTKTGSHSGAPTGGGLVTVINGIGTSTVSDTLAENVNLALQDTQSTGLNVSSTASVLFNAAAVSKFSLDHPGNMNTGARLGYTVSREDQYNNFVPTGSTTVYLHSNSTDASRAFFDAASGGNQIASTTIQAGSTSTQFWYYDTVPGTYAVTAYDNPAGPDGTTGIDDATDSFSVVAGAVKFIFANVPASATAGDTITFNVYAVDSFNTIDTSFNRDVTVTKTGSASGGGLVDIVNGTATTTVTDLTAESVVLGLDDTQTTGLGATDSKTVVFSAAPVVPAPAAPSAGGGGVGVPIKPNPWVDLTFSGYVYPGATISLIRKDLGLLQGPVLQTGSSNNDGTFLLKVNHATRLTGQTYIIVFADRNGQVSQTRAYNIPAGRETFGDENTIIAPSIGFGGDSVVTKGKTIIVQGYATPKATVKIFVDGNETGSILVNNASGQYRFSLPTDNLDAGRHSVQARQTIGTMQSDGSNQQSFTVSTLANPRLDLNGDGIIDIKDVSIYLSYLKNLGADLGNLNTVDKNLLRVLDLNGDGTLNVQDLSILLRAIGR